ncbi:hypothetical protein [Sphingomonas crocodyli]|uniref:DUF3828 domain-containing protein n=1 Tax=Sphingomonas crocodyli TaxID=1979270 RepID=A0A437LWF8_9SPHN|nr:hypothetical protein [Sphingomonas crocodyli]RVT89706.1 hypothetical protein EOD43_20195 [Sphingomonas crocodyli]
MRWRAASLLVAAGWLWAGVAPAAQQSAEDYVLSIYEVLPDSDWTKLHYAPKLDVLIRRDQACAKATRAICRLDFDPLCGCQDFAGDYRLESIRSLSATRVEVVIDNGGRQVITIDLEPLGARWAIADIHHKDVPSLVALLSRDVSKE